MCIIAQTPLISPFGSIGFREREREEGGRRRGYGDTERKHGGEKNIKKYEKLQMNR